MEANSPLFNNDQGSESAASTGFSVHNGVHIPAIEPRGFIDDQANPVEVTRPPPHLPARLNCCTTLARFPSRPPALRP